MSQVGDIRAALEERLDTIVGFPSAANRAYENVNFRPTTGATWARITLSITGIEPATRGDNPQYRYDGLFLVTLAGPQDQGPGALDDLADLVRQAYTVSDVLTKNGVNVRFLFSDRSQGFSDTPWYLVPVTVRWYTYLDV